MTQHSVRLPDDLADKVASWPEVRMGVNRVTLLLRDGSRIGGVLVAGNKAVGLYTPAGAAPLPSLSAEDVVDVEDDSDW
jgi:hypothetical protein